VLKYGVKLDEKNNPILKTILFLKKNIFVRKEGRQFRITLYV
jgi:hypothetical protein